MAQVANIYIDQGTDFQIAVDVTDAAGDVLNLTGFTAVSYTHLTLPTN